MNIYIYIYIYYFYLYIYDLIEPFQYTKSSIVLLFPVKPAQEPPAADLPEHAAAPATQPVEPKACSLVVYINTYIYI